MAKVPNDREPPETPDAADESGSPGVVASPFGELLVMFVVAVALALLTYAISVRWAYEGVYKAYRNVNVIGELLSQDSLVPANPSDRDEEQNDASILVNRGALPSNLDHRVLFRTLQMMGLKSAEDSPDSIADEEDPYHKLYRLLVPGAAGLDGSVRDEAGRDDSVRLITQVDRDTTQTGMPTAEVVAHLIARNRGMLGMDAAEYRKMTANMVSALLAHQPGASRNIEALLEKHSRPDRNDMQPLADAGPSTDNEVEPPADDVADNTAATSAIADEFRRTVSRLGTGLALRRCLVVFPRRAPSDEDILRRLYDQVDDEAANNALFRLQAPGEDPSWDQLRVLDEFAAQLLSLMHASPEVKDAQRWVAQFRGPEQLGMWLCLWWMFLLLGVRWLRRTIPALETKRLQEELSDALPDDFEHASAVERSRECRDIAAKIAAKLQDKHQYFENERALLVDVRKNLSEATEVLAKLGLLFQLIGVVFIFLRLRLAKLFRFDRKSGGTVRRLLDVCARELKHNPEFPSTRALTRVCRDVRAHDTRARWIIIWLASALPAIGFIGTVRGIATALSNADSIVRASDVSAQAAAITDVAGMLGVAFTTTLMALLMGLVTSFFSQRQSAAEQAVIDQMQSAVERLIDPA